MISDHEQIVAALAAGGAERAANTLSQHVASQGDTFHHFMNSPEVAGEYTMGTPEHPRATF